MLRARHAVAVLALLAIPTTALGDESARMNPHGKTFWDLPLSPVLDPLVVTATYTAVGECDDNPYLECSIMKYTEKGWEEGYGYDYSPSCRLLIPAGKDYRLKVVNSSTCTINVVVGIRRSRQ